MKSPTVNDPCNAVHLLRALILLLLLLNGSLIFFPESGNILYSSNTSIIFITAPYIYNELWVQPEIDTVQLKFK